MKRKMAPRSVILIPGKDAGTLKAHLFFLVFK